MLPVRSFMNGPLLRACLPGMARGRCGALWQTVALLALCWLLGGGAHAGTVYVADAEDRYALWPALTMLSDPQGALTAEKLIHRSNDFSPVPTATGTLGLRKGAVWVRTNLAYLGDEPARWALTIDFPPLERAEIYVLWRGEIVGRSVLGSLQPMATRQLRSRSHTIALDLLPHHTVELLIRLETEGAMLLPIVLAKPAVALYDALAEQMLQGLLAGLAVGLLAYSLMQWWSMRDPVFLYYALLTLGGLLFSLQFFGVGAQYLWGGNLWAQRHAGALAGLLSVTGIFLFVGQALEPDRPRSRLRRATRWSAALTIGLALLYALDAFEARAAAAMVALLGGTPALLGAPRAVPRALRGDQISITLLFAWAVYYFGASVLLGVIGGHFSVNFWTLHSVQFVATLNMLLYVRVLGLRSHALRVAALSARRERDAMRSLAHTDALTGLANRRGLHLALTSALAHAQPSRLVAIYLLDLDGFKPINDAFGHDAGDTLLVAVARRLQRQVRRSDLVARLGGDEFVVMVRDPGSVDKAHVRGVQLLEAFHEPFVIGDRSVRIGLTIGYALAPVDGTDAVALLKRADAAMYEGKQDGKFCVRRLARRPQETRAA